jgi:LysM repeat protein
MKKVEKKRWLFTIAIAAALLVSSTFGANLVFAQEDNNDQDQQQQNVLFQDDFTTLGLWATIVEPELTIGYADGFYLITNNFVQSQVSSVRASPVADVIIEVDANRVAGPETGYYGAVCRWQDIQNYYALVIGDGGLGGIVRVQNGFATFLAQTNDLELEAAAWNRVGGECAGNQLTLWVNGEQILEATDGTFAAGSFGMMVGTRGQPGVSVVFDNLVLSQADVGIIPPTGPGVPVTGQIYIVQPTDNLNSIAARFGTTVAQLLQWNPQIVNPNLIFAGQRIVVPAVGVIPPTGPGIPVTGPVPTPGPDQQIYIVQPTDNLTRLAIRFNTTVQNLLQINPQIINPNLIFAGQRILVPTNGIIPPTGPGAPTPGPDQQVYIVQPGDTLRIIAARFGTTVQNLLVLNPQIVNPNLIFAGQRIIVPATPGIPTPPPTDPQFYTVQPGDTLFSIATRFGTTVQNLLALNPQIVNPNLIFPGQQIRVTGVPVAPTPTPTPTPPPDNDNGNNNDNNNNDNNNNDNNNDVDNNNG